MTCDPNLSRIIDSMQAQCESIYKGMFVSGDRPWMDFRDLEIVGKFEFDKVHELFNRDKANEEYLKLRQASAGKAKIFEVQTAKLSVEYLATLERDYRMRHRSRIRNFVHAGVRMKAKSLDSGPLRVQALNWLDSLQKEVSEKGGGT